MTVKRTLGPVIPGQVMQEMLRQQFGAEPALGLDEATYTTLAAAVLHHDELLVTHSLYSDLISALLKAHHGATGAELYMAVEMAYNSILGTVIAAAGAAGFYLGACHARNNPDYEPDHATLFNLQEYLTEWAGKDRLEAVQQFLETLKGGAAHAG